MTLDRELGKDVLLLVLVAGCIWVILTPSDSSESNAAFGLLGVVVAYLCRMA